MTQLSQDKILHQQSQVDDRGGKKEHCHHVGEYVLQKNKNKDKQEHP